LVACIVGAIGSPAGAAFAALFAVTAASFVALGALALFMAVELANGVWFAPYRRDAEAVIATLPALAAVFIPVLLGARLLYGWTTTSGGAPPDADGDTFPSLTTWIVRAVLYWTAWIAIAETVRRASLDADRAPSVAAVRRLKRDCVLGLLVLAVTTTLAVFDWLMSLTPGWSSSVFGLYVLSGGAVAALALWCVTGARQVASAKLAKAHLDPLGRLLLTCLLLWLYFGFVQYLIIWIADLPREVTWYSPRVHGVGGAVALLLLVGQFGIPFLALLLRPVRRSARVMGLLGAWLLLMHVVETWWIVVPGAPGSVAWLDVASVILVVTLAVLTARFRWQNIAVVAPRIATSERIEFAGTGDHPLIRGAR
jgi:hypothetical protein